MVNEYKKVDKPSSIGSTFKPELVNKLNNYCSLTGTNRTKFISDLIEKALEGKILTNDFIELDKPYYFNLKELIKEGSVEATTEKPSSDLYNQMIIKKVPNNLDTFEEGINSYCYDNNSKLHRGIISFNYKDTVRVEKEVGFNEEKEEVEYIHVNKSVIKSVILVFDYNFSVPDINHFVGLEKNTLKISSINFSQLPVLVDGNSKLLDELNLEIDLIKGDVLLGMLSNCILWKRNNTDVINYFHLEKNPYHINNILKAFFNASADNVEEAIDLLHNLVIGTVEGYVENRTLTNLENGAEKSIQEIFKEVVIELDYYNNMANFSSDNPKKVYNLFSKIEDNKYVAIENRLVHYVDNISNPNEEANIYSFINAFPFDMELFEKYSDLRIME